MKQWTERDATSNAGIAKVHRIVTDMGYIWRPTPNSDVGLDGEIEIVEDRAATAKIIKAQVKSGVSYFRKEDQRSFEYQGSKDDLAYWLKANNPVLLLIYHPERDALYGIHVQGYVDAHPDAGQSGVLKFDKIENLLLPEHGSKLKQIVFKDQTSTRLPISVKRREKLLCNFLPLIENIEFLYSLPTPCLNKAEVRIALGSLPNPSAFPSSLRRASARSNRAFRVKAGVRCCKRFERRFSWHSRTTSRPELQVNSAVTTTS